MDAHQPSVFGLLLTALLAVLASLLAVFLVKLYNARILFVKLQKQGMPMPPGHGWAFGHLLFIRSMLDTLPKDAHKMLLFGEIVRRFFSKQGVYYIDLWPFSEPFLILMSPTLAMQTTQTTSTLASERPPPLRQWFLPLAGGPNLFDLSEREWKPWRAIFNKGFSANHLLSLVPNMVEETLIYCETLRGHAREGGIFHLDPVTLRFTMDLIGRTVLNTSLNAQKGYNTLADSMLNQIQWHMTNRETNLLGYLNIARFVMQWWNGRQMDIYISKELGKRYKEYQADLGDTRSKAIIDLVLQAYVTDMAKENMKQLDPEFRLFATRQIRLFVFAGHDSTSSTICYLIHLLSVNPDALARVRSEHDSVFGTDLSTLPSLLSEQPHLLNSLPYTLATIKETMRLFPAASAIRSGSSGTDLVDDEGNRYPTDKMMIWILHSAMQRAPEYWVRPDDFIPERWLVGPEHELYPLKGAWRPFEYGPRNCIGSGLVMVEMRVALVMIVREFDFKPAYAEWDRLHPRKGMLTYRSERAYQVEEGAAHPADRYPCRVFWRQSNAPANVGASAGNEKVKKAPSAIATKGSSALNSNSGNTLAKLQNPLVGTTRTTTDQAQGAGPVKHRVGPGLSRWKYISRERPGQV